MSSERLTEEQRKRIEENRRKALEKRAALLSQRQQKLPPASTSATSKGAAGKIAFNNAVQPPRKEHALLSSSTGNTSMQQRQLPLQSDGVRPGTKSQSVGPASNTYIYTNGHAKPSLVGSSANSQKSSMVPVISVPGTSHGPDSLTSFQSTVSQFYHPQNNPSSSSSMRKFETSNSSSATASISANTKAGPLKTGATSSLNFRKSEKEVKGNCVLISRNRFTVVVPYQAQLIGIFKTIPSKRYDAKTLQWDFSLADYNKLMQAVQSLPAHVIVEGLPKAVISTFLKITPGTLKEMSTNEINLNSVDFKLVEALMPFQRGGVSFSIRHDGRVLIADDMGLGKTIQAICVACYYRPEWPLLIITPSSLRITWQQV